MTASYRFILDALEPGLILAGRNPSGTYGKCIRGCLGSYTNHNGMIVRDNTTHQWGIGEAIEPLSITQPLNYYEKLMDDGYIVRIWRVINATDEERERVSEYWKRQLNGLPYADFSIAKLGVFRFVNSLPWRLRIHGVWCTQLVFRAWRTIGRDPFLKPNGLRKKNPTPRTLENRLVSGAIEDVTDCTLRPI